MMNKYSVLSILCIMSGIILLGYGISIGQGKVYWLLIIPVIEGTGVFSVIGIFLMIIGIFSFMFSYTIGSYQLMDEEDLEILYNTPYGRPKVKGSTNKPLKVDRTKERPAQPGVDSQQYGPRPRGSIKTGGVLFIGPIPIIWGSDKRIAYIMALVSVVLVFIFMIFLFITIF